MADTSHQHHHRHHHRHSAGYRIRRWLRKNKKLAIGSAVICIAALAAGGTFLHQERAAQSSMHVTAGNSVDMKSGYRRITYQGKE